MKNKSIGDNCKFLIFFFILLKFHRLQSDIEMDIEPSIQKHRATPKRTEADEPNAKRQKVCEESSSEKDDASEKTAPTTVDEPAPTEEKDSNAKVT